MLRNIRRAYTPAQYNNLAGTYFAVSPQYSTSINLKGTVFNDTEFVQERKANIVKMPSPLLFTPGASIKAVDPTSASRSMLHSCRAFL